VSPMRPSTPNGRLAISNHWAARSAPDRLQVALRLDSFQHTFWSTTMACLALSHTNMTNAQTQNLKRNPRRSGLGLRLTSSAEKPWVEKTEARGRNRVNGGSDPGSRRLAPPQTFPCSSRRSGGRYRRDHLRKQVVFTMNKQARRGEQGGRHGDHQQETCHRT